MVASGDWATLMCTPGARGGSCGDAGTCNADGVSCSCDAGFVWDQAQTVYPHCFTPSWLPPLVYVSTGLAGLAVGLWSAYELSRLPRSKPLAHVVLLNTLGCFFIAAHVLAHALEGAHRGGTTAMLLLTIYAFTAAFSYLLVLLLRPITLFARVSETPLKMALMGDMVLLVVITATTWGLSQVGLANNDIPFFNAMATLSLVGVGAFAVVFGILTVAVTLTLRNALKPLELPTPGVVNGNVNGNGTGSDENSRVRDAYLAKLNVVSTVTVFLSASTAVLCLAETVAHFATGAFPFRILLYWLLVLCFPAMGACLAWLARRSHVSSSSRNAQAGGNSASKSSRGGGVQTPHAVTAFGGNINTNTNTATDNPGSSVVGSSYAAPPTTTVKVSAAPV